MANISSEQISGTEHHGRILLLNVFKCHPWQLRELNTPSLARQLWYSSLKASFNQSFVFVSPFHSDGGVSCQWCYTLTVDLSHERLPLAISRLWWWIQTWWFGLLQDLPGSKVLAWCQAIMGTGLWCPHHGRQPKWKQSSRDVSGDINLWWVHNV